MDGSLKSTICSAIVEKMVVSTKVDGTRSRARTSSRTGRWGRADGECGHGRRPGGKVAGYWPWVVQGGHVRASCDKCSTFECSSRWMIIHKNKKNRWWTSYNNTVKIRIIIVHCWTKKKFYILYSLFSLSSSQRNAKMQKNQGDFHQGSVVGPG